MAIGIVTFIEIAVAIEIVSVSWKRQAGGA
jgi:hypothetical protein